MAITCPNCGHQYDSTLFVFGKSVHCDCGTRFDISEGHLQKKIEPIQGVLIDLAGVLYVGDEPIPGAVSALDRLSQSGLQIRFVTNTTRSTADQVLDKLSKMGFSVDASSMFTAPIATRKFVQQHDLRPLLLVHPDLLEEFAEVDCDQPNAVVVGDAGDVFSYQILNRAFRILMDGGQLIGMGCNRYFQEADGLSMDMGPFVELLRFASGVEPTIIGKPAPTFFQQVLDDICVPPNRAMMIGDDLENDIGGAQSHGIRGVLVRTGKYRPSDEVHATIKPHLVVDTFADAVEQILQLVADNE